MGCWKIQRSIFFLMAKSNAGGYTGLVNTTANGYIISRMVKWKGSSTIAMACHTASSDSTTTEVFCFRRVNIEMGSNTAIGSSLTRRVIRPMRVPMKMGNARERGIDMIAADEKRNGNI